MIQYAVAAVVVTATKMHRNEWDGGGRMLNNVHCSRHNHTNTKYSLNY